MEELQLETQELDDEIQEVEDEIQGLENRIQRLEEKNQELKDYIQELDAKNQEKNLQLHEQKERIDSLESKVCELNDKHYRPDLRGMLNLFREKVYIILFYSIFNTLILFLLLHVVGLDTVKKKTYGLPRWLAHQIFYGTSRNRRERR